MKLTLTTPAKSLNKAYLKQSIKREEIEIFKSNLSRMFGRIDEGESEEHLKNIVSDFLKETYYKDTHYINTKDNKDLVIHNGKFSSDSVGVIIEAKRPSNKNEMVSKKEANAKALHELVLYYLRETVDENNHQLKHLIATNIYEWFIFDAVWFEKNFYRNTKLRKEYDEWKLSGHDTKHFYERIAAKYIGAIDSPRRIEEDIPCSYFNLKDFERVIVNSDKSDDSKLIDLYKILSPEHLLKQPFTNDSNSLNKEFYSELLHIIGLTENKNGGKKVIERKTEEDRNEGSLLENTIRSLTVNNKLKKLDNPAQYGENENDQLFSVALELCITWLNRILFLKLLEGQLIKYHSASSQRGAKGAIDTADLFAAANGDTSQSFLNTKRIADYDELNELFFEVLAVPVDEREKSVQEKFSGLPYLNSSLFEETDLESETIVISALKGRFEIPLYSHTVLKETNGKRLAGIKKTLQYLFEFLDAYDFSSDSSEIIQEENKTIINASVLGLIFEKINGYKDGSFFTPGFITMYMCRETIRKAVVQKFKEEANFPSLAEHTSYKNLESFDDLKDKIDHTDKHQRKLANDIINSLKICDPAVGSGHFLVSALNEIIAIKSDLRILNYRDGSRIKGYKVTIENDELIIINEETDRPFEYALNANNKPIAELQQLQETLFNEKQTIIEDCLFGVDINPKSVMICRLRLWIELLKNAYYTDKSKYKHLETLPNIDINIKCGNSLISRYDVNADLSDIFRKDKNLLSEYRIAVATYKNSTSKENKAELQRFIESFKEKIVSKFYLNNPLNVKLSKLKGQLVLVENKAAMGNLFEKLSDKDIETDVKKLKAQIEQAEKEIEELKSNKLYENAFEWRFEFPEVLDDDGKFLGFDMVIGNPPYISIVNIGWSYKKFYESTFKTATGRFDLYSLFIEKVMRLKLATGAFTFIVPGKFLNNKQFVAARNLICNNHGVTVVKIDEKVFDEAQVDSVIVENYLPSEKGKAKYKAFKISSQKLEPISETTVEAILEDQETIFRLDINPTFDKLIDKIERDTFRVKDIGDVKDGIISGLLKDILFLKDKKNNACKRLYFGKHLSRYSLIQSAIWVDYRPDFMLKEELKRKKGGAPGLRMRNKKVFERDKIIYRKVGKELIATYSDKGIYYEQTLHGTHIIDKRFKTKYVLALFNSKLFKFYYQNTNSQGGDIFPQVRISSVENLPIKLADKKIQNDIEKLVDKILDKKQSAKGGPTADTSDLEKQIDEMVYELYGLTEEEIKIVEGR